MLLGLTWLIGLTEPLFTLFEHGFSWRDLILIVGGLFLLFKATHEIHAEFEHDGAGPPDLTNKAFTAVILQVAVIDIVFSIDSIITAIGMAQHVPVMITAVIIAMGVMWVSSGPVGGFIHRHPTTKMLALAFLMLIGVSLVADGVGMHIPRALHLLRHGASPRWSKRSTFLAKRRRAKAKAAGTAP